MKSNDLFKKYLFKFNVTNVTFFYWIIDYLNSIVSKNDLVRFEKKINKGDFDITANFNSLFWHNQFHTFSAVKVN